MKYKIDWSELIQTQTSKTQMKRQLIADTFYFVAGIAVIIGFMYLIK